MNNTATNDVSDALNNAVLSGALDAGDYVVEPSEHDTDTVRVLVREERDLMERVSFFMGKVVWMLDSEFGYDTNGKQFWVLVAEPV